MWKRWGFQEWDFRYFAENLASLIMQKEDISLLISVHWKADHESAKTITSRRVIGKFYLKKSYSWYLLKLIPESSHIRKRSFGKQEREKRIICWTEKNTILMLEKTKRRHKILKILAVINVSSEHLTQKNLYIFPVGKQLYSSPLKNFKIKMWDRQNNCHFNYQYCIHSTTNLLCILQMLQVDEFQLCYDQAFP